MMVRPIPHGPVDEVRNRILLFPKTLLCIADILFQRFDALECASGPGFNFVSHPGLELRSDLLLDISPCRAVRGCQGPPEECTACNQDGAGGANDILEKCKSVRN